MRCTLSLLCWVSALLFLSSWAVSAEDIADATNSPTANASAPMGLHGYRRYFANDSLIGRPVPCSRDDKICFRHNLVFNPEEERCGALGFYTTACRYEVNATEFDHGSGRLVASCAKSIDPCTGYRMAYDGVCYEKEIVHDVICGQDATLTLHPFGDAMECREAPARPSTAQQPQQDNSCVIPDLRFPDKERSVFFNNPYTEIQGFKNEDPVDSLEPKFFECESGQAACFSEGYVFVSGFDGCHSILKQGPCTEDHIVALNVQAATEGRAEGTCVHVRGGCPKGYKRMAFDGECHEDREIQIEAPGDIVLNQFGSNIVVPYLVNLRFSPEVMDDNCTVNVVSSMYQLGESPIVPVCGVDDSGSCKRHETVNVAPVPDLN